MLGIALALIAASAAADPLTASFAGWRVEIEDDLGGGDSRVRHISTDGCVTTITGEKGRWLVDWRTIRTIALADVFVFLEGPGLKIAAVADVRDESGLAKLRAMRDAMAALRMRCATGGG